MHLHKETIKAYKGSIIMKERSKRAIRLIENIGLIAFGVTDAVAGASIWSISPILAVSLFILSPIWIIRGIAELMEVFSSHDKTNHQ